MRGTPWWIWTKPQMQIQPLYHFPKEPLIWVWWKNIIFLFPLNHKIRKKITPGELQFRLCYLFVSLFWLRQFYRGFFFQNGISPEPGGLPSCRPHCKVWGTWVGGRRDFQLQSEQDSTFGSSLLCEYKPWKNTCLEKLSTGHPAAMAMSVFVN